MEKGLSLSERNLLTSTSLCLLEIEALRGLMCFVLEYRSVGEWPEIRVLKTQMHLGEVGNAFFIARCHNA